MNQLKYIIRLITIIINRVWICYQFDNKQQQQQKKKTTAY